MKVEKDIQGLLRQMREIGARIRWLRSHRSALESLPSVSHTSTVGRIDFDNLSHKEIVNVIRTMGGKWKKTPSSEPGRIDYETVIDGVGVRCWQGEPPPSCRIVEVEEYVPEHVVPAFVRTVKKMVCQPSLVATMAQIRDKHANETSTI